MKTLVVNADDFGFTEDVNAGIIHAHQHGVLTATTLMANGDAFRDAVRLARENPSLDVGCHFVLVGNGHSLVPPYKSLPRSIPRLAAMVYAGQIDVEAELDAQLRRISSAGIHPVHIDAHKHTHLLPPVLHAIVRVAHRYGIRFIRRPFDLPIGYLPRGTPLSRRPTAMGMQLLRKRFAQILAVRSYMATDHFAGFQITGHFRTADMVHVLDALPEGSTEFMTHPGYCQQPLRNARTRLKESRVAELEALTSPEVREAIERNHIRLTGYRGLLGPDGVGPDGAGASGASAA